MASKKTNVKTIKKKKKKKGKKKGQIPYIASRNKISLKL